MANERLTIEEMDQEDSLRIVNRVRRYAIFQ